MLPKVGERIVGMVEPGMDQPTWFKMEKGVKYFVPTLDKFLMLYDPQGLPHEEALAKLRAERK